jgi:uncharacterized membrane protein YhaH (DUF805 family)
MRALKFWEKLAVIFLTSLFIITTFLSFCISIEVPEAVSRFVIFGLILIIISVASFFGLIKILIKRFNYKNRRGAKIFFYSIVVIPSVSASAILLYENSWPYVFIYFILVTFYFYMVEKYFGKFNIRINAEFDKLSVENLTSFNTDIKVIAKNKKVKSSREAIKVGDIIEISKNGEPILTLDVIKNKK